MESDDRAVRRRRFLEAVARATPPLHAKNLRVPGLDRRIVQKRLERLRRGASPDDIADDQQTIDHAREELLRSGPPVQRGLARLSSLASPGAAEFVQAAGMQTVVIGDWVEFAHSPGDLGWSVEQVQVEEQARDEVFARGRAHGWMEERERFLEQARALAGSDPDLRRNLEPNLLKMDLVGLRSWGTSDAPLCAIQVAEVDWLTCFALNARLDAPALTGDGQRTVRDAWGDPRKVVERRGLPGMIVAHVVVLTSDGHFIVARRQRLGIEDERGTWSLSIEERWQGPNEGHESDRHPHDVVRRGVREELGISVAERDVRVLAWGIESAVLYPGFVAIATTDRPSWELAGLRPHATDSAELTHIGSVPARLASIRLVLEETLSPPGRPELTAAWHRTARARLFIALAHIESLAGREGRTRVLAQLGRQPVREVEGRSVSSLRKYLTSR